MFLYRKQASSDGSERLKFYYIFAYGLFVPLVLATFLFVELGIESDEYYFFIFGLMTLVDIILLILGAANILKMSNFSTHSEQLRFQGETER